MRLSIFNFRFPLALSVLAWGLSVTVVYGLLFWIWHPQIEVATEQYSLNRIKAERYIYALTNPAAVIVGSSLSALLPQRDLGADVVNLSFAGVGPMTGLEIVRRSPLNPAILVIETEFLLNGIANELIDELFAPGLLQIRRLLPGMRHEFQPVTLVLNLLWKSEFLPTEYAMLERPDPNVLSRMLPVHQAMFANSPPKSFFDGQLNRLKVAIAEFSNRGITTVLLEMPIDPVIEKSPGITELRRGLKEAFPDLPRIRVADQGAFLTRDGLHLTHPDAARAAREIAAKIDLYRKLRQVSKP